MDGRGTRRATRARIREPPPPLPRLLQSALLVRGGRVPLRRRRREGGRRSVMPAEPGARDLVAASRARCRALEARARGGCRSLVDTGGATVTGAREQDYQPRYDGDRRARDGAYHQGTVWPWLIGPFIDAWLKVDPDRAAARRFLEGILADRHHKCIGTIGEIFDAEEPFTPRGCVAQAWSVAEVLRAWVKTADPA